MLGIPAEYAVWWPGATGGWTDGGALDLESDHAGAGLAEAQLARTAQQVVAAEP